MGNRHHVDEALGGAHNSEDRLTPSEERRVSSAIAASTVEFVPGDKAPTSDPAHAHKKDVGKIPVWQGFLNYFPRAVLAVALVSEYGKRKYAPDESVFNSGWRDVPEGLNRYLDADARHMVKRAISTLGEYDEESGMAHLAHKAWNAMAELERAITDGTVEVRIGNFIGSDGKITYGTSKKVEL